MSSLVFPTPPGISINVTRTPVAKVGITETISGKEWRQTWQSTPRYRYRLNMTVRSTTALKEFQKLMAHWAAHFGPWDSFLYTDPEDNAVTTMGFGTGDGSTTSFQLQRSLYPTLTTTAFWPAFSCGYEPVFDLNGSPSIYKAGVLQTLTTHYTLPGQGVVTFGTAPANGAALTWTGSYYRRVRFDGDSAEFERVVTSWWRTQSLTLISVLP